MPKTNKNALCFLTFNESEKEKNMFTPNDILQIKERGSELSTVEQQMQQFQQGFPPLQIIDAATNEKGIITLLSTEIEQFRNEYEQKLAKGLKPLKFVPASGAASRMFKSLFNAQEQLASGKTPEEVLKNQEIISFYNQLSQFAFYPELEKISGKPIRDLSLREAIDLILNETGLNYGQLPKGLLAFHYYESGARTPFEEHLSEGAGYSKDCEGNVQLHFTVSPEHLSGFEQLVAKVQTTYENSFSAKFNIQFSQQKSSTDTIAVDLNNEPFRNSDGSLLFRPAGHGALLENLKDLDADLIFIKNIDNVVPDHLKPDTILYKKALAGLLLYVQEQIFNYQQIFDTHHYYSLNSAFYAEASNFLENILQVRPPDNQYYTEKEELFHYLKGKFNRPIRVCGMVKNEGEPGGGPFFALNSDGSISLQIAESSQIASDDLHQQQIAQSATHFNPVDLVCAIKNYKGEKFDLSKFRDPDTGFISVKSKDGKNLKALELPGLWNGAMSDWITLFAEVPVSTFNPVKTVNDLLRKEHQVNSFI